MFHPSNEHGINSSTPGENLHMIRSGLMKDAKDALLNEHKQTF